MFLCFSILICVPTFSLLTAFTGWFLLLFTSFYWLNCCSCLFLLLCHGHVTLVHCHPPCFWLPPADNWCHILPLSGSSLSQRPLSRSSFLGLNFKYCKCNVTFWKSFLSGVYFLFSQQKSCHDATFQKTTFHKLPFSVYFLTTSNANASVTSESSLLLFILLQEYSATIDTTQCHDGWKFLFFF